MPTVPLPDDSTRLRFKEARDRYTERNPLQMDSDAMHNSDEAMLSAVKQLKKIAERDYPRAANTNKFPGLPIPLPVKPILPEQIAIQSRTNELIEKLTANTSKDITLRAVISSIGDLANALANFTAVISERFGRLTTTWSEKLDNNFDESAKKEQGWVTKVFSSLFGRGPDMISLGETFKKTTKPITEYTHKTVDKLNEILILSKAAASKATLSRVQEARDSLNQKEESGGMFAGIMGELAPDGSKMRKAIDVTKSTGNFFGKIGEIGAKSLGEGKGGTLGAVGSVLREGTIGKFIGLFGGIAGMITMAVGGAAFSSIYALFKNPDQLVGMLGAFGNLFSEVVIPAFQWIVKEIIPPISMAFSGLMYVANILLDAVGTHINDGLIYIIGTALPAIFTTLGAQFDALWQAGKRVVKRVAGIFGFGEYGEDGFFGNIAGIVSDIAVGIQEALAVIPTKIIRWMGLQDWIGLKDDESIAGRIRRFILEDIPNEIIKMFNSLVDYVRSFSLGEYLINKIDGIIGYFYSPASDEESKNEKEVFIRTIKDKLRAVVSSITTFFTDFIPSWEDIKGHLFNLIPNGTPDFIKNIYAKAPGITQSDAVQGVVGAAKNTANAVGSAVSGAYNSDAVQGVVGTTSDVMGRAQGTVKGGYSKAKDSVFPHMRSITEELHLDEWKRRASQAGSMIYAPNNQKVINNNMTKGGGGSRNGEGIGSTEPPMTILDKIIINANPY